MDVSPADSTTQFRRLEIPAVADAGVYEVTRRVLATLPTTGIAVSVVLPVYNEETIIRDVVTMLLHEFETFPFQTELVVCENGSTDLTRQILEIVVQQSNNVTLCTIDEPSYGRALKTGIDVAQGELVVLFNADLWCMRFFVDSVLLLRSGYDVVIGSKRLVPGRDARPVVRRLLTAAFSRFLKLAFGFRGTDTHGMKALRRSSVLTALRGCVTEREVFDTELVLRLQRAGARICELPVAVNDSRPARLSLLRRVPSTALDLWRIWKSL